MDLFAEIQLLWEGGKERERERMNMRTKEFFLGVPVLVNACCEITLSTCKIFFPLDHFSQKK